MSSNDSGTIRRTAVRTLRASGLAALSAAALVTATATSSSATPAPSPAASAHVVQTAGRAGVVPLRGAAGTVTPQAAGDLRYGGGVGGIGVETSPRVYLVFWGSQWNTDSRGVQSFMTRFFQGAGTSGDHWSAVTTQYCQGVAAGTTSCGTAGQHPRFTGSVLAGTWADNASASPVNSTASQLGNEALRAAQHFGNTTSASNTSTQYMIVSPTGSHPDGFPNQGFCAYHTFSRTTIGNVAWVNMPYVRDAGASCGQSFVNAGSAGDLDGFSIVSGHEYLEAVTDQFPGGGWTDTSGAENADKCAWISSGTGASTNITLPTGTFAVQSTYSNSVHNCAL